MARRHFPRSTPTPNPSALDIANLHSRLQLDSYLILIAIILGYFCFVFVSVSEGRRYARVHTEMLLAAHRRDFRIRCSNFPVGMFNHRQLDTASVVAQPGDLFLMFTDGVVEINNKQDEEFGLAAVQKILSLNPTRPLAEILSALINATNLHGTAEDDRFVLLVKCARTA